MCDSEQFGIQKKIVAGKCVEAELCTLLAPLGSGADAFPEKQFKKIELKKLRV